MKKTVIILIFSLSCFSFCKAQWYEQPVDINAIFCVDFLNQSSGIIGGIDFTGGNYIGKAFYTTNAGNNWNLSNFPDSTAEFVSCIFINDNLSYMGGDYYDSTEFPFYRKPFIVKSTDQGRNWTLLCTFPDPLNYFTTMDFLDENTGYASIYVADADHNFITNILKTTDAGQTWTTQLVLDSLSDMYSIDIINENDVIAVGANGNDENDYHGALIKTTNGGQNWQIQDHSDMVVLDDVFFTDDETGFFTSRGGSQASGYVFKTTNQGDNWTQVFSEPNVAELIHIDFCKRTGTGRVYGQQWFPVNTFIFKTTDYGNTWTDQNISFSTVQAPIVGDMVDTINYYIGCTTPGNVHAKVFHTTNGGSVFVNNPGNIVPSEFRLYQNYPNPFNPKTTIEYSVPFTQLVTIKVFDILGNEVAILYSGKQFAGTYSVEWDAANFPSGIYFYNVTAGKFTETKKMMVVK